MGLDASEMSVSPAQNFWKPPPVPAVATVTLTPGSTARNRSAAASLSGATVDDPSTVTVPLTPPPLAPLALPELFWPPHPLTNSDATAAKAVTPASFKETADTSDSFHDPSPVTGGRRTRQQRLIEAPLYERRVNGP